MKEQLDELGQQTNDNTAKIKDNAAEIRDLSRAVNGSKNVVSSTLTFFLPSCVYTLPNEPKASLGELKACISDTRDYANKAPNANRHIRSELASLERTVGIPLWSRRAYGSDDPLAFKIESRSILNRAADALPPETTVTETHITNTPSGPSWW